MNNLYFSLLKLFKMNEEVINDVFTLFEIEVFEYLNELRDYGVLRFESADPYIMRFFNIDRDQSVLIYDKWVENFNEDGYSHLNVSE